jgi:hypothetical protein
MARRQPLRLGSHLKGKCERNFWRPLGDNPLRILDAFRRYQVALRKKGERFGPGGALGERILRYLINITGRNGRCDPALARIAEKCNCCVSAVVNTLKELKKHGFLNWIRRYTPAADRSSWGPQVKQTSNAYRVELPPAAAALLEPAARPPADFEADKKAKAAEIRDMENHTLNEVFDRWSRRFPS